MLMPALLCWAALGAVSCHRDGASISGRLAGASDRSVLLEETTASGAVVVDSVRTDRNGDFRIRMGTETLSIRCTETHVYDTPNIR